MLLGTAHVTVGSYQKASVCHLNHLASSRDLGDFPGITKAECNLGITYARQGLFQLAERCFSQVSSQAFLLMPTISLSACFCL